MTFRSYAQNFEDYLLWRAVGHVEQGFYVDVGANDPDTDSVSKAFAERGWRGIEVEPQRHLVERLLLKRPNATVVEAATGSAPGSGTLYRFTEPGDGMSTFDLATAKRLKVQFGVDFEPVEVPIRTLTSILEEVAPVDIHWMKIDVEGFEAQTLSGLDLSRWRPWVISIEAVTAGNSESSHELWEDGVLAAGYDFALFDGLNRYYVSREHSEIKSSLSAPVSQIRDDVEHPRDRANASILLETMQHRDRLNAAFIDATQRLATSLQRAQEIETTLAQSISSLTQSNEALTNANASSLRTIEEMGRLRVFLPLWRSFKATNSKQAIETSLDLDQESTGALPKRFVKNVERFEKLNTSKRLKAQAARRIITRFPPDPRRPQPLLFQRKLLKWLTRGYELNDQERSAAAIFNGSLKRAVAAPEIGANATKLILSETYAATFSQWENFLRMLSGSADEWNSGPRILAVLSDGGTAKTRGETVFFDIVLRSSETIGFIDSIDDLADDDWVFFVGQDDTVLLDQLSCLTRPDFSDAQIVIPDSALVAEDTVYPILAPGANYLFALNCEIYRSRFLARAGAARAAILRGANSWPDIALDLLREAHKSGRRDQVIAAGRPMIEISGGSDHLERQRANMLAAKTILLPAPGGPVASCDVDIRRMDGVSVVICTKDKGFYIRQLVSRLLDYPEEIVRDVIIVSNNTSNEYALETLRSLGKKDRVKLIRYNNPFHFSDQSNVGAKHARGGMLLFLNDDIVPISERWLEELIAPFIDPKTVASGPLLLYPDERIQHAGMVLGYGEVAGHVLSGHKIPEEEFNFLACTPRYTSCLTGAVLLVRKSDFDAVHGFDLSLRYWIQDVDLCMRLSAAGGKIVFNPQSILFHMESLTVRETLDDSEIAQARWRELQHFRRRWGNKLSRDPYHPVLLEENDLSCRQLTSM